MAKNKKAAYKRNASKRAMQKKTARKKALARGSSPESTAASLGGLFPFVAQKKAHKEIPPAEAVDGLLLLKIELHNNQHPVWRRILISSDKQFSDLHNEIQRKFEWDDDHIAGFFFDRPYGPDISERTSFAGFVPNPKLKAFLRPGVKIFYVFDYGDDWIHSITVEDVFASEDNVPQDLVWSEGEAIEQYPNYDDEE
ncbi:MAG: plasmid pRiA4b ORF-3 family protein [Candidatus Anaerobiospirillum pullicola]|uniref:Plasmid pRiA4b ORF-3 family protein n=1 Tax=Candidatus Anaerobiospirillum pullicola TaxID=2838451 RepID=A0A948TFI5_9GAMM|nr:plasmid pRiA4b ORF-3 family protein [Candidatus Anaerobiospirillum pullicola]